MDDTSFRILVVDDEESIVRLLEMLLIDEGYWVGTASCYDEAMKRLQSETYDLIISDIFMHDADGLTLLRDAKKIDPDMPVILITAYASLSSAIEALRNGAFDYITKPFEVEKLKSVVKRALENRALRKENIVLKRKIREELGLEAFIGSSAEIRKIKELVRKVAPTDATVLITGESGTGKDLLARIIHNLSRRSGGPFMSINCAALPETLLESELFGYVKGAFTGADKNKDGLFLAADGGTFFLDEVGETSPAIQAKLLRMLETHEIIPLGSTTPVSVDVRLIAATNSDLRKLVEENKFRQDLYYRLNVIHIHIPSLRERREDILSIADSILESIAQRNHQQPKSLSSEAQKILVEASLDGNVRELQNVLERAVLLCPGNVIKPEHLPSYMRKTAPEPRETNLAETITQPQSLEEIEKAYIFWVLNQTGWNKTKAAQILGIDLSTLYRKIEKYNLLQFKKK